jgi:hypothetical protein
VSSERVSVTRRIAAPARDLFAIVSSPAGHVDIDGSGMLVAAPDATAVSAVGDTFVMDMDRAPLNDFPEMGKYKVLNTVTKFVPDRLFEWNVGGLEHPPLGHVYGWQLEPVSETETDVTNYCDWTEIAPEMLELLSWPIVPLVMLEHSVEKLERIATEG